MVEIDELSSAVVSFLFTDIEGSTRLWDDHGEAMAAVLARHDRILRGAIESHGGAVFATGGDGVAAAFAVPSAAVDAAIQAQRELASALDDAVPIRVRMAVHMGTAEQRDGDFFGPTLNRAARLMAVAHGGQILASAAVREVVDQHAFRDLGVHRLRDLSKSERVFQVLAGGLAERFPPLRSLDSLPTNLRPQLTSFVGRESDVARVLALLSDHRLVTLTGAGGVGKTRLAVQVAAELLPEFSDGAWLAELASASDDDSMAQVVATAVGAQPRPGKSIPESVVEFLRSKVVLVVLDNCEHLLDATGRLAADILAATNEVRILATSREGLGLDGEHLLPLRSLALDVAEELFAERATAARGELRLDSANAAAVTDICRRLDGIPLAIELAAARTIAMTPADIAAHLDERFRLLTGGKRTAVERHQTLRAAVEWSYLQLRDMERHVFDRLGVFAGRFDRDAASEVVSDEVASKWDVLEALSSLVAKSLVVLDERGQITRYELLETLRQYALEQLAASGDMEATRRRHARCFAARADALAWRLVSKDELAAREDLALELDNIRAAVTWSLDRDDPDVVAIGLRIITMLNDEPNMAPGLGIGAWAERAQRHLDGADPVLRAGVLAALAYEAHHHGENERAIELANQSVAIGALHGVPSPGTGFSALSIVHALMGNSEAAVDAVMRGEKELQRIGAGDVQLARLYGGSITALLNSDDLNHARTFANLALEYARRSGNGSVLATAYFGFGCVHTIDDPDAALAAFEQAIEIGRHSFSTITGPSLYQAAYLRLRKGDTERCLHDLRTAVALLWEHGQEPQLDGAFGFGAEMLALTGHPEAAFVIIGAIVGGALQRLKVMPVPPERDPAAVFAEARNELSDDARKAAMQTGMQMSYRELVEWLLATLDEAIGSGE